VIRLRIVWTNWLFGLRFWPVRKDLAVGVDLGPLKIIWTRDREKW